MNSRKCNVAAAYIVVATALCAVLVDIDELRDSWFSRESVGVNDGEYVYETIEKDLAHPYHSGEGDKGSSRLSRADEALLLTLSVDTADALPEEPKGEMVSSTTSSLLGAKDWSAWRLATNSVDEQKESASESDRLKEVARQLGRLPTSAQPETKPPLSRAVNSTEVLEVLANMEATLRAAWSDVSRIDEFKVAGAFDDLSKKLHAAGVPDPEGSSEEDIETAKDVSDREGSFRMSCDLERVLRKVVQSLMKPGDLPALLRFIFHDAVDENNLLVKGGRGGYKPLIAEADAKYGGLDLCLYSPLSKGTSGVPEAGHNRNLHYHKGLANLCRTMCKNSADGLCKKDNGTPKRCLTDMVALASIIVLNKHSKLSAPSDMLWGRNGGQCARSIVTPFTKDGKQLASYKGKPALNFAPALHSMDSPKDFGKVFERLGFTPAEHVALMGAHSVGKISPCATGLNGVEVGNFCNRAAGMDPPLQSGNLAPTCMPQREVQGNCFKKKGYPDKVAPYWRYHHANDRKKGNYKTGYRTGFADGGVWDHTPHKLDNQYYKLMRDEDFSGKDNCCGKIKGTGCHRVGTPVNRKTKKKYNVCDVNWCRSDRKGNSHLKSTRAWVEPSHRLLKLPYFRGTIVKLLRLAGDWALLGDAETKPFVKQYADDQDEFHKTFARAWNKVLQKGYFPGELKTCSKDQPTSSDRKLLERLQLMYDSILLTSSSEGSDDMETEGVDDMRDDEENDDDDGNLNITEAVIPDLGIPDVAPGERKPVTEPTSEDTESNVVEPNLPKTISTRVPTADKFFVMGQIVKIRSMMTSRAIDQKTVLNVGEELSTLRDAVISFVGKRETAVHDTRMQTDFMKKLLASDAKTQELLDDAKKTCSIKDESISVYESVYGAKKPTSTFSYEFKCGDKAGTAHTLVEASDGNYLAFVGFSNCPLAALSDDIIGKRRVTSETYTGQIMFKLDQYGTVKLMRIVPKYEQFVPTYTSTGKQDGFLVQDAAKPGSRKYAKIGAFDGAPIWTKSLPKKKGEIDQYFAYGMQAAKGGAVIVLPDLNPGKIRVVKINGRNGKVDWTSVLNSAPDPTKTLNRAFCKTDRAGAVVGTADGGALFVGSKVKGKKKANLGFAKFSKANETLFEDDDVTVSDFPEEANSEYTIMPNGTQQEAQLGYCVTKGCNFEGWTDLWTMSIAPRGRVRRYNIPYSNGFWPAKDIYGLAVTPLNSDYVVGGAVCDFLGHTKKHARGKKGKQWCTWDTKPFLMRVDSMGRAMGRQVVWQKWKGYSEVLAIKPRKDGNGVLVVTRTVTQKKVEGLSHVRYGKKFLTITNKKLFPLKTITIYEGYDSPSIGYTRFIYDGEPVIHVASDGGYLLSGVWHECHKFDDTLRVAKSSIVNTNGTASPGKSTAKACRPRARAPTPSPPAAVPSSTPSPPAAVPSSTPSPPVAVPSPTPSPPTPSGKDGGDKKTTRKKTTRGKKPRKKAPKKAPKKARKKTLKNSRTKTTPTKTPTATTLTTTTPTTTPTATTPTTTPTAKTPTDDGGANEYTLERENSRCVGIPLKRLRRTKSLDKCVKEVTRRGGLYFAYRSKNGVCYEQPKPWTECRRIRRGPYHLYSMKAELALGHAEPALGHAHGREISMRYVALTIGTCVMAFIAVRVHRRSKRWTNIEESRTLDPRNKRSYGAVV